MYNSIVISRSTNASDRRNQLGLLILAATADYNTAPKHKPAHGSLLTERIEETSLKPKVVGKSSHI